MNNILKKGSSNVIAGIGFLCVAAVIVFSISLLTSHEARAAEVTPAQIAELRTSAEKGDASAQWLLGYAYQYGDGVPEDDAAAVKWFTKAAEQGLARAQFNLGLMYGNGEGVPEDDAAAVKWYTKAAEQGDARAQFNLGVMYANGEGVPQDNVLAYLWWNLAAAQSNASAKENKGILQERMTPAGISTAQELSRECLAKNYKNCG